MGGLYPRIERKVLTIIAAPEGVFVVRAEEKLGALAELESALLSPLLWLRRSLITISKLSHWAVHRLRKAVGPHERHGGVKSTVALAADTPSVAVTTTVTAIKTTAGC